MSAKERQLRSKLTKLLCGQPVIRGTLLRRQRVCGKPRCKCTRGLKHEGLYLVVSENGKPRQFYVPKELEAVVQQWVQDYRRARELMEGISRIYWDKLHDRRS